MKSHTGGTILLGHVQIDKTKNEHKKLHRSSTCWGNRLFASYHMGKDIFWGTRYSFFQDNQSAMKLEEEWSFIMWTEVWAHQHMFFLPEGLGVNRTDGHKILCYRTNGLFLHKTVTRSLIQMFQESCHGIRCHINTLAWQVISKWGACWK